MANKNKPKDKDDYLEDIYSKIMDQFDPYEKREEVLDAIGRKISEYVDELWDIATEEAKEEFEKYGYDPEPPERDESRD